MEKAVMKSFKLTGELKELKTGNVKYFNDIIIEGICGNDAVSRFKEDLNKEGKYSLGNDYYYFQLD